MSAVLQLGASDDTHMGDTAAALAQQMRHPCIQFKSVVDKSCAPWPRQPAPPGSLLYFLSKFCALYRYPMYNLPLYLPHIHSIQCTNPLRIQNSREYYGSITEPLR